MFRKKLDTLLREELVTLLKNNSDLREKLEERMLDSACFWLEDYLAELEHGTAEYSINYGGSYGDYFEIKDDYHFVLWAEGLQKAYCFYSEEEEKKIKDFEKLSDLYEHCRELYYCGYSYQTGKYGGIKAKDYYNVEHKYDDLKQELEEITLKRLRADFDYITEYRTGASYETYLLELWYSVGDLVLDDLNFGAELFTDHNLTNIYEYEPGYYEPARIINIPAHAEYIPEHREPATMEKII